MKTKTYIQPATQVALIKLQTVICLSIDEGGKTTEQEVWDGADVPKRKINVLYI